jgi:hypothetical protein
MKRKFDDVYYCANTWKQPRQISLSARRILVELAAHCPFADDIFLIVQRLSSGQQLIFF